MLFDVPWMDLLDDVKERCGIRQTHLPPCYPDYFPGCNLRGCCMDAVSRNLAGHVANRVPDSLGLVRHGLWERCWLYAAAFTQSQTLECAGYRQ